MYIFPTAFPCGLPERIRQQLLDEYKGRLRKALYPLIDEDSTASGLCQSVSTAQSINTSRLLRTVQTSRGSSVVQITGYSAELSFAMRYIGVRRSESMRVGKSVSYYSVFCSPKLGYIISLGRSERLKLVTPLSDDKRGFLLFYFTPYHQL